MMAITLGRPGATSSSSGSQPKARIWSATRWAAASSLRPVAGSCTLGMRTSSWVKAISASRSMGIPEGCYGRGGTGHLQRSRSPATRIHAAGDQVRERCRRAAAGHRREESGIGPNASQPAPRRNGTSTPAGRRRDRPRRHPRRRSAWWPDGRRRRRASPGRRRWRTPPRRRARRRRRAGSSGSSPTKPPRGVEGVEHERQLDAVAGAEQPAEDGRGPVEAVHPRRGPAGPRPGRWRAARRRRRRRSTAPSWPGRAARAGGGVGRDQGVGTVADDAARPPAASAASSTMAVRPSRAVNR